MCGERNRKKQREGLEKVKVGHTMRIPQDVRYKVSDRYVNRKNYGIQVRERSNYRVTAMSEN